MYSMTDCIRNKVDILGIKYLQLKRVLYVSRIVHIYLYRLFSIYFILIQLMTDSIAEYFYIKVAYRRVVHRKNQSRHNAECYYDVFQ